MFAEKKTCGLCPVFLQHPYWSNGPTDTDVRGGRRLTTGARCYTDTDISTHVIDTRTNKKIHSFRLPQIFNFSDNGNPYKYKYRKSRYKAHRFTHGKTTNRKTTQTTTTVLQQLYCTSTHHSSTTAVHGSTVFLLTFFLHKTKSPGYNKLSKMSCDPGISQ